MSYRNDQFFNLPTGTETGAERPQTSTGNGTYAILADNPPFVYPDRTVRTIDSKGNPVAQLLQRGYIRSLANSIGGTAYPIKKCAFQFNPATIQQMVSQNDSMLNFIQQDPGQYIQPMPGNVNFSFELMFDRSMELNNPTGTGKGEQVNIANPWELNDPSEVGVLRDLSAFYAAIGQGMSESQRDYVLQSLTSTINREANKANASAADSVTSDTVTNDINSIPQFLDMNVGNSAFLLPLPVRVVFSTLYIVEGLVQSTSVTFTKFNTSMVPMACVLGVVMEAKYIGFAKKRTFLSAALDDQKQGLDAAVASDQSQNDSVLSALAADCSTMELAVTTAFVGYKGGQPGTAAYSAAGPFLGYFPSDNFKYLDQLLYDDTFAYLLYSRLPNANAGSTAAGDTASSGRRGGVSSLFNAGTAGFSVGSIATVDLWGPYSLTLTPGVAQTQQSIKSLYTNNNGGLLFHAYTNKVHASTNNEWKDMIIGGTDSDVKQQRYPSSKQPKVNGSYYILKYTATISATLSATSGSQTISGYGETWQLLGPLAVGPSISLKQTVPIAWATPVGTLGGTVPVDNAAAPVRTQQPGTQSKVGARTGTGFRS